MEPSGTHAGLGVDPDAASVNCLRDSEWSFLNYGVVLGYQRGLSVRAHSSA